MSRTSESRETSEADLWPAVPVLPFVEVATRGHTAERFEGEDHERWIASLERREADPYVNDPTRESIPPELSVAESALGPDLE